MKVLITGGNGYIAKSIYNKLKDKHDIILITRNDFDLTNSRAVNSFFDKKYFDVLIHTAIVGGSRLKQDNEHVLDDNLIMYYNLLMNKGSYGKFINLGSGAELLMKDAPYGLSKHVIRESILNKNDFYNIRIFGVFDENELDTRFIKANVKRYINNEPMMIQNKRMSFFYMDDLIMLINHYITSNSGSLITESNCSYTTSTSLLDIANIINELDDYKVPIYMDTQISKDYESTMNVPYSLNYIGLRQGIKNVYNKLKNEH
ncbi:MAG: NAD-dependent epimerase/dehydratase family protein [Bacteroidota bacterium]